MISANAATERDGVADLTLRDLIARMARDCPDLPALGAPGGAWLSYLALQSLTASTAEFLQRRGLGHGDRVAVVLRNGPEMAAAFVSIAAASACAPLNPGYREAEFEFYLTDLRAKALVVESGVDSPVRNVARTLGLSILELTPTPQLGAGAFTLAGGIESAPRVPENPKPGDTALLLHTSGTTSRPKLVPLSQANLCASAHHIRRTLHLEPGDRCLNVMPLFHIHGLIGAALATLSAGGSVLCAPGWDAERFFDWLNDSGATWYTAVPTIHQSVLAAARQRVAPIAHQLRFIRSSSAALPPSVLHELEQVFGAPVIESYGMTEATHQMCSNPLPPGIRKPGSVGLPAGPDVAVMNETGELLGANATGELVIRGPNVTAGYENNAAANETAFMDGWFRTGDQGFRDADGYFFLTGRLKELINRGGEKVAPREVDEALLSHPAVAQAVAFAVPHPRLGEDVAVAIVLRPGAATNDRELRDYALGRLAPQKVPSRFLFVESIPKGPTGKLQRIGLAQAMAAHFEVRFVPPETPIEVAIARVWSELLQCERISRLDNFFSLGGDSLMATRALSRLAAMFDVELPLGSLFQGPTLEEQAALIENLLIDQLEGTPESGSNRQVGEPDSPDRNKA
ncbi:MAG: AMP-binding protein [Planctomycetales bacterium]